MLRQFKRKFSITAPRLSVRPHVPWYVRWAITLPFIFAAGWMVWWAYDAGLELAGFHRGLAEKELDGLRQRLALLEDENKQLSIKTSAYERQAQIDHAAALETTKQVQALNDENMRLQEDLAFFQNLPLTTGAPAGLSIHRFKIEAGALPGEYHCRLLLVQNVQRVSSAFQGYWQLLVNTEQAGKKVVLSFPLESNANNPTNLLNFKFYQRVEQALNLAPEIKLLSVEVRIFEKGVREAKFKQLIDYKQ